LVSGKDVQDLTYNLDEINKSILPWFDKNRLIINKGKSLTLGFHHKLNKHIVFPDVILNDRHITYENKTKFLGVWLDHNLSWDFHVENLINRLSKLCFALKTAKAFLSRNVLRTMYFAYFLSLLKYDILFWGNSRNLKKVFKLQKRAVRLIANIPSTASCMPYLRNYKIMTLSCLYIYEVLLYTRMSLDTFKTNSMFHSYDTRNKSKLFITRHNTTLFEQIIAYSGVLIYNRVPSEIKGIKSTTLFKKTLTKFLLEKSFYAVEEFMTANF
jgi:hypothetical protein